MPYLLWIAKAAAITAVAGGSVWAWAQPDTVTNINLPDDMSQGELDAVLSKQPASLGDGLTSLSGAAAAAAVVYLIVKKG